MIFCSAFLSLVATAASVASVGVGTVPPTAVSEVATDQVRRWFRKLVTRRTNMRRGAVPPMTRVSRAVRSNGASGSRVRGSQRVDPTLYVGVRVTPTVLQRIKAKLTRRTAEASPPGPEFAPSTSSRRSSANHNSPVVGDAPDLSSFRSTTSRRSNGVYEPISAPSEDASSIGGSNGTGVRSRHPSGIYESMSAPLDGPDWPPVGATAPRATAGISQRGLNDGPAIKYPNGKGAIFGPLPSTPATGQPPVNVKYPNGKGAVFGSLPPSPPAEPGRIHVKYPNGKGAIFGPLPSTPAAGQPPVNVKYPNGKGEIFGSVAALLGTRASGKFANANGILYSRLPDVIDPSSNAGLSTPGLGK